MDVVKGIMLKSVNYAMQQFIGTLKSASRYSEVQITRLAVLLLGPRTSYRL